MIINIPENTNLKKFLTDEGFHFPCGGEGLCGRCKIIAPAIAPTNLDRTFLSETEINSGFRLACDKTSEEPAQIDCLLEKVKKYDFLEHPSTYAYLGDDYTEIGIIANDEIIDKVTVPSPEPSVVNLRAVVGRNSIELFEKYNVAVAETLVVVGSPHRIETLTGITVPLTEGEVFDADKFQLPATDVYIPPVPAKGINSDIILELLNIPDNSLFMKNNTIIYKGDDIVCFDSSIFSESDISEKMLTATLMFFKNKFQPEKALTTKYSEFLHSNGFEIIPSYLETAIVRLLESNRTKTILNRIARRIVILDLANEDEWHNILSSI